MNGEQKTGKSDDSHRLSFKTAAVRFTSQSQPLVKQWKKKLRGAGGSGFFCGWRCFEMGLSMDGIGLFVTSQRAIFMNSSIFNFLSKISVLQTLLSWEWITIIFFCRQIPTTWLISLMSHPSVLFYDKLWPALGGRVLFSTMQKSSERSDKTRRPGLDVCWLQSHLTFLPVKNCLQKGEPFTSTMKLGVPAFTKNLLTQREAWRGVK